MAIYIKYAETTEEFESLFYTRHQVFVEEESYMTPSPDGRIFDRFDVYPTTANIIAVDDGQTVGGVRFMEATEAGIPTDEFFDFTPYLTEDKAQIACAGQFCLQRKYRRSRIALYLLGMAHHWALSNGFTRILCVVNPEIQNLLMKIGYRPVACQMYDKKKDLPFVPMILDMKDLGGSQLRFVSRQQGDTFQLSEAEVLSTLRRSTDVSNQSTQRRYQKAA